MRFCVVAEEEVGLFGLPCSGVEPLLLCPSSSGRRRRRRQRAPWAFKKVDSYYGDCVGGLLWAELGDRLGLQLPGGAPLGRLPVAPLSRPSEFSSISWMRGGMEPGISIFRVMTRSAPAGKHEIMNFCWNHKQILARILVIYLYQMCKICFYFVCHKPLALMLLRSVIFISILGNMWGLWGLLLLTYIFSASSRGSCRMSTFSACSKSWRSVDETKLNKLDAKILTTDAIPGVTTSTFRDYGEISHTSTQQTDGTE